MLRCYLYSFSWSHFRIFQHNCTLNFFTVYYNILTGLVHPGINSSHNVPILRKKKFMELDFSLCLSFFMILYFSHQSLSLPPPLKQLVLRFNEFLNWLLWELFLRISTLRRKSKFHLWRREVNGYHIMLVFWSYLKITSFVLGSHLLPHMFIEINRVNMFLESSPWSTNIIQGYPENCKSIFWLVYGTIISI